MKKEINKLKDGTKKYMYKKILFVAMLLVVCLFIVNIGTYAYTKKTIIDVFFQKDSKFDVNKSQISKLMDNNGQTHIIDDYTIKLESTIFEDKTDMGYCTFSIKKKNGKPEADIDKWKNTPKDIFGNRFQFDIMVTGSRNYTFEMQGDTLYAYVSFAVESDYNGTVELIDYKEKDLSTIDGYKRYIYKLKSSSLYKKYKIDNSSELYITPIGVTIDGNKISDVELKICNSNESLTIIDTKNKVGIGNSSECSIDNRTRQHFVFKKLKDIRKIDYIIFNGKKYNTK